MVIPVHDINPLRRTPWITYGLIAANVWAYAVGGIGGGGAVAYVAHVFGFIAGLLVGLAVRAAGSGAPSVPAR